MTYDEYSEIYGPPSPLFKYNNTYSGLKMTLLKTSPFSIFKPHFSLLKLKMNRNQFYYKQKKWIQFMKSREAKTLVKIY